MRTRAVRYAGGVILLAAAYYAAAKVGQTLRYTASVSAIWPPAGLGIAALYLWGLRWWPGILLGELVVNAELLHGPGSLPLGSVLGQQAGNMAEVVVGALLLRRLIGSGAALDRAEQVGGTLAALAVATAISATAGTASMLAGAVISASEAPTFWRTWWLGDLAGGLVVAPLALVWARAPRTAWRRMRSWEWPLLAATVAGLAVLAVSTSEPVTYVVFPALIWAAFRFGPPGATLAIAIATGVVIGVTASDVGPFFKQPIDHRTLSTQTYIVVTALTTLFLAAMVSERQRSAEQLAASRIREEERALEERHRIARELHDSVSQTLFSTLLHTRAAQNAPALRDVGAGEPLRRDLRAIAALTTSAQTEMRALIFELDRAPLDGGLGPALAAHAAGLDALAGLDVDVESPPGPLGLSRYVEAQLFGIGREAISNVAKHAAGATLRVRVAAPPGQVVLEIADDGGGFDPHAHHPGHFGLASMRARAADIGGELTISSDRGSGTVVRIEVPAGGDGAADDD